MHHDFIDAGRTGQTRIVPFEDTGTECFSHAYRFVIAFESPWRLHTLAPSNGMMDTTCRDPASEEYNFKEDMA